jgi:hypothetical protein
MSDGIITVSRDGIIQEWDSNMMETSKFPMDIKVVHASLALQQKLLAVAEYMGPIIILDLTNMASVKSLGTSPMLGTIRFNMDGSRILVLSTGFSFVFVSVYNVVNESLLYTCFRLEVSAIALTALVSLDSPRKTVVPWCIK